MESIQYSLCSLGWVQCIGTTVVGVHCYQAMQYGEAGELHGPNVVVIFVILLTQPQFEVWKFYS